MSKNFYTSDDSPEKSGGGKTNFLKFKSRFSSSESFCTVDDTDFVKRYKEKKWCSSPADWDSCRSCSRRLTNQLKDDLIKKNKPILYHEERPCKEDLSMPSRDSRRKRR